jgi:hypothetical protein
MTSIRGARAKAEAKVVSAVEFMTVSGEIFGEKEISGRRR